MSKVFESSTDNISLHLKHIKDTSIYKKYSLPDGFRFEFYKDGNMNDWINIHIESGEFCAI